MPRSSRGSHEAGQATEREGEALAPVPGRPEAGPAGFVLALQQAFGNQVVVRTLARQPAPASSPPITAKRPDGMTAEELDRELKAVRNWLIAHPNAPEAPAATERVTALERELLIQSRLGVAGISSATPMLHSLTPGAADFMGRISPFARPPTAREWAMIDSGRALHYTSAENAAKIAQTSGGLVIKPSPGLYRNLTVPYAEPSGYFFLGEPGSAKFTTNMAGRGGAETHAFAVVDGMDLPPNTLFRPLDEVLVVPGGYKGPGIMVRPGGKLPAPGSTSVVPRDAPGGRSVSEPGAGATAGAAIALSVVYGEAHAQNLEDQRKSEGYAPAGPAQSAGDSLFVKIGRWLIDPFLDEQSPAAARFDVKAWRAHVRQVCSAKKQGETATFNWQIHKHGMLGQSIEDVEVHYQKGSDGQWRPDKDRLDGRHHTPDLNLILGNASDARVESELDFSDGA